MFLEGCPLPQFGCSVLLRGGNQSELSRVKRVMSHMIFCRYNWRLELSYLMDEFACPPNTACDTFFEDSSYNQNDCNTIKQISGSNHPSGAILYPCKINSIDSAVKWANLEDIEKRNSLSHQDTVFSSPTSPPENLHLNEGRKSSGYQSKNRRRNSSSDQPDITKRVTAESVSDFSDPLHQYLTLGEEESNVEINSAQHLAVAKIPYLNQFRKALDDTILSVSPYLKVILEMSTVCIFYLVFS